ncbi:hypothetical protein J6590_062484 [Homalodisca vitripennis]|nr:hypothetical protein J6590_062484 [Homalodisca vitripennis]
MISRFPILISRSSPVVDPSSSDWAREGVDQFQICWSRPALRLTCFLHLSQPAKRSKFRSFLNTCRRRCSGDHVIHLSLTGLVDLIGLTVKKARLGISTGTRCHKAGEQHRNPLLQGWGAAQEPAVTRLGSSIGTRCHKAGEQHRNPLSQGWGAAQEQVFASHPVIQYGFWVIFIFSNKHLTHLGPHILVTMVTHLFSMVKQALTEWYQVNVLCDEVHIDFLHVDSKESRICLFENDRFQDILPLVGILWATFTSISNLMGTFATLAKLMSLHVDHSLILVSADNRVADNSTTRPSPHCTTARYRTVVVSYYSVYIVRKQIQANTGSRTNVVFLPILPRIYIVIFDYNDTT